jgi:hypothetical protein
MSKNSHAVALGRLGGYATKGVTSPKKKRSSKRNGKKGGWWSWHEEPSPLFGLDLNTKEKTVLSSEPIKADNIKTQVGQQLKLPQT